MKDAVLRARRLEGLKHRPDGAPHSSALQKLQLDVDEPVASNQSKVGVFLFRKETRLGSIYSNYRHLVLTRRDASIVDRIHRFMVNAVRLRTNAACVLSRARPSLTSCMNITTWRHASGVLPFQMGRCDCHVNDALQSIA